MNMIVTLVLLLVVSPLLVFGQTTSSPAQARLNELDFLLGEWKGTGCQFRADRSCIKMSQTIKVQRDSTTNGLRIEDTMKPKSDTSFGEPPPSLSRRASLAYDDSSHFWMGNIGKSKLRGKLIDSKTFQWEEQSESGTVTRTTIKLSDDNEWHHTVEFWLGKSDGWFKGIESVLKRSK